MDLVILEKIGPSILNGLGYIERLEKKNGSKTPLCGSFTRKIAQSTESSETAIFGNRKKLKALQNQRLQKIKNCNWYSNGTGSKKE